MDQQNQMTVEEIHDFGVQIVYSELKKEGYEIISVNADYGMNPQIVGKKDDQLAFVAVRTACFPEKGQLEQSIVSELIEHAERHQAIPYFASVGIANAEAECDDEMSIPVKGAGFHVAYEGMVVLARSSEVRIFDKGRLRKISDDDVQG
jgi:hypothetical protein